MIHAIRQRVLISDFVLIRLGVISGLIVGLMGVGLLSSFIPPELVLIAVAVPPVVLLALSRLEFGVLAIVLTAAFVRFSLPTGTQSRIVASLLMTVIFTALWLARMLVVDKKLQLKPLWVNIPLLGFVLIILLSYVWGNAFRDPLVMVWSSWPFVQLGALAVMVFLPGAFILASNCLGDVKWLKWLFGIVILVGVLHLIGFYFGLPPEYGGFINHPLPLDFVNARGLFPLWFVVLAYGQVLFNKELPWTIRLFLAITVGVWVHRLFIIGVTWLSGWIPVMVGIVTLSFLRSKWLFLIILILGLVYLGLNWDYYVGPVLERETAESGYSRLDAWAHNWRVTGKHLLFGVGPAGYAAYYMSYFPGKAMATHSNYIDILSQTGIVGLIFCLWFFGALGWVGYKLCLRLRGHFDFTEGFAAATLAGCVGCVVAMGLGDWLIPFVYTQTIAGFDYAVYSWVLLGTMVSLHRLVASEAADKIRRSEPAHV